MIDHYLKDGPALKPNKKASSWETNRTIFDCHVRPLVGRRLARDLTRLDVAKMQLDISQGKTVRNVKTGCRKAEILALRWVFVDWELGCLRLPESKTGAKVVPLADAAIELLRRRWDESRPPEPSRGHNSGHRLEDQERSPFVLPAIKGDGHYVGLPHVWTKVDAHPERRDRILEDLAAVRSDAEQLQAWAIDSVIRQLEEVFSDLFGLYVFGAAYLYAYEYFLAPGATARSARYPASRARVGFLLEAAKTLNISADPKLFIRWRDPQRESAVDEEVLFFADQAVETTVPLVQAMAFDHLRAAGVTPPDPLAIARIRASFETHVPDGGGGGLAEIVCAGWDYLRQRDGLAADDQQSEYDMLNELMLKSIEVSEFLLRVNSDA